MRIRWSLEARQDLLAIRRYIAEDNPRAAARVAARIRESAKLIGDHPWIGREDKHGFRELVVARLPYMIGYRVDESAELIMIVSVIHTVRDRPPGP